MITPSEADDIIMAAADAKEKLGYRVVSMAELRKLYGLFMEMDNLHMPMAQYLGMMLDVVRVMTHYKGVHSCSLPMDSWVYQEIIHECQPNVIIEIGNQAGGQAMYLRDLLFEVSDAKYVIGIDITRERLDSKAKAWPDIKWIDGDACSKEVLAKTRDLISSNDRVMVIDDSSHEYEKTLAILENFSSLVTKDQYFIVEDTLIGHFVPFGTHKERAYKAVIEFMESRTDFVFDRNREKWFITLNPYGYLHKIG